MLYVLMIHIVMDIFEITISMINYLLYVIIIILIYGIKMICKMPIILTLSTALRSITLSSLFFLTRETVAASLSPLTAHSTSCPAAASRREPSFGSWCSCGAPASPPWAPPRYLPRVPMVYSFGKEKISVPSEKQEFFEISKIIVQKLNRFILKKQKII
jgi:hypothetical protein